MKRLITIALGLGLVLGLSTATFAQTAKPTKAKSTKMKSTKMKTKKMKGTKSTSKM